METIFHEKQEGSLCAQHCLNALLQGSFFTAVDLATLGLSLDEEERSRMAESGLDSEEYRRFIAQPSGNMDDSGYFSVQVISRALQVWGLELVPYSSTEPQAVEAKKCPSAMQAFICNYRDHWFTIRKLGHQWFNLNSLLSRPELISDTYLAMFLAQLQQEGYSIFLICGDLPDCRADLSLKITPYLPEPKTNKPGLSKARTVSSSDDEELRAVLALSLADAEPGPSSLRQPKHDNSEDEALRAALALSLEVSDKPVEEEDELHKAMQLSLECSSGETKDAKTVDRDEIRRKRLAFLDSTKS